jgi:hypothetical protein
MQGTIPDPMNSQLPQLPDAAEIEQWLANPRFAYALADSLLQEQNIRLPLTYVTSPSRGIVPIGYRAKSGFRAWGVLDWIGG